MPAKTYASFRTAGGRTVNLRWEPPPQNPGEPPSGVYANCAGCPSSHGPGSEYQGREWAHAHAQKCTA